WYQRDRRDALIEIALEYDVETLVLCAGAVICEVQRLVDEGIEVDRPPLAGAASGMLQHASYNAIGTPAVLDNLREIAFQGRRQFVDLGLTPACEGIVQLVKQIAR